MDLKKLVINFCIILLLSLVFASIISVNQKQFASKKSDNVMVTEVSSAQQEWKNHLNKTEPLIADGGLVVAPDVLREYLISLESFSDTHKDFHLKGDVDARLKQYISLYLFGLDNTPVFGWDENGIRKMNVDFKESYEKFLQENTTSKYYQLVKEFYEKAKQNNYIKDANFDNWYYNEFNDKVQNYY